MGAGNEILARLDAIEAKLDRLLAGGGGVGEPLPDVDVNDPRSDRDVKMDLKKWTGESMKGRKYSECPPEFLDLLASTLKFFAGNNEKAGNAEKAKWDRLDAARCIAWAAKHRANATTSRLKLDDDEDAA